MLVRFAPSRWVLGVLADHGVLRMTIEESFRRALVERRAIEAKLVPLTADDTLDAPEGSELQRSAHF